MVEMLGSAQQDTSSYAVREGDTVKSVLLLYSGGLDTSCLIPWIREQYNCDVYTLMIDIGQQVDDFGQLRTKALKLGAVDHFLVDAKRRLLVDYAFPAILAEARVGPHGHPLASSLTRPLIAEIAAEIATRQGIDVIAHGASGKSNDSVRFDTYLLARLPKARILAPVRDRSITRTEELVYAASRGIEVRATVESPYSVDDNLWGLEVEAGDLDELGKEPAEDTYIRNVVPQMAPDKAETIEITFDSGRPVAVDGACLEPVELVRTLNAIGARHGVGRFDCLEDRAIGIKAREIHEAPAAHMLMLAVDDLFACCLTPECLRIKQFLGQEWSRLMLWGRGLDPAVAAIDDFLRSLAPFASGTCRLSLYKGSCRIIGRRYPHSLDSAALQSREVIPGGVNQSAVTSFIELSTLPLRAAAAALPRKQPLVHQQLSTADHRPSGF